MDLNQHAPQKYSTRSYILLDSEGIHCLKTNTEKQLSIYLDPVLTISQVLDILDIIDAGVERCEWTSYIDIFDYGVVVGDS